MRLSLEELSPRVTPAVNVTIEAFTHPLEGGLVGVARLTRDGDASQPLAVNIEYNGTADPGDDYYAVVPAGFAAGAATMDVLIHARYDRVVDPFEDVAVFVRPGAGYVVPAGELDHAVLVIGDAPPTVHPITIYGVDAQEGPGGAGQFVFERHPDDFGERSVTFTLHSTAVEGEDYDPVEHTITFAAGQRYARFFVYAIADGLIEGPENLVIVLESGETGSLVILDADFEVDPGDGDDDGPGGAG